MMTPAELEAEIRQMQDTTAWHSNATLQSNPDEETWRALPDTIRDAMLYYDLVDAAWIERGFRYSLD